MLGLPQQIGRAHLRVAAIVGDDQRLRGAGEQIDPDAAGELPLGLGHVGVSGTGHHVAGRNRSRADRHRTDCLDTAQAVDRVRTGQMHGGDDGRRGLALEGRRAGDHPLDPGHLRGQDGHVRRGEQRIFAAGHVAADAVHRNVPVAQDHAGQCFDLDVLQRVLLDLGEIADLRLREPDVVDFARRHGFDAGLDLRRAQLEGRRVPVVELARILAHRLVAALLDVGQDGLHGLADLGDVGGILLGADAGLQIRIMPAPAGCRRVGRPPGSMTLNYRAGAGTPRRPAAAMPDAIVARSNTKALPGGH